MNETNKNRSPGNLEQQRHEAFEAFRDSLLTTAQSIEIAEKKEEEIDWEFENEKLSLEIRKEKKDRRKIWNKVLLWLVVLGFILSYTMIVLIGAGILNFDNNAFAVPSVVAAGVLETYGLAKIAARYFFSDDEAAKRKKSK